MKNSFSFMIVPVFAALLICSPTSQAGSRGQNRICREQYRAAMRAAKTLPRGERKLAKERARREFYLCTERH